ncbi:MAG: hypothetical protein AAB261_09510 [Chloroflexota bacterium]
MKKFFLICTILILVSACNALPQVRPTAIVIVVTPTLPPPTAIVIVVTATPTLTQAANLLPTNPPAPPTPLPINPTAIAQPSSNPTIQPSFVVTQDKPNNPTATLARPTSTSIVSAPIPTPYNNNVPGYFGPHQNGFFIYISDRKEIWAFMGPGSAPVVTPTKSPTSIPIPNGQWLKFPDTFTASDPQSDPSLVEPTGLLQPKGGFGKVWRANPNVRAALGWATDWERPYIVNITDFYTRLNNALVLQHVVTTPDGTNYFVDESKGTWEIRR